jgi:hypothetical protein
MPKAKTFFRLTLCRGLGSASDESEEVRRYNPIGLFGENGLKSITSILSCLNLGVSEAARKRFAPKLHSLPVLFCATVR